MKAEIIKILENRAKEFLTISHSYEHDELQRAISVINRLVPPSQFDELESQLEKDREFKSKVLEISYKILVDPRSKIDAIQGLFEQEKT